MSGEKRMIKTYDLRSSLSNEFVQTIREGDLMEQKGRSRSVVKWFNDRKGSDS